MVKVLHIPKGLFLQTEVSVEELWRAHREAETQSTHNTHTKQQSTTNESVAFTYTDTTALTAELTPSSRLMTQFQFFSSVPHWTKDTFMLARGLMSVCIYLSMCVCVHKCLTLP